MNNVTYLGMISLTNMGIAVFIRDVNVLIFLDFSFRYDSVHQKY